MGLTNNAGDVPTEVDVIIAGGGTAGCVVAGRLAQAAPELSILVVEGGRDNTGIAKLSVPISFLQSTAPGSDTALFYASTKDPNLGDREIVVPTGGVLGGSSSVNYMAYARAQRRDWDSWRTPGWSTDEMLPYLTRPESHSGPTSPATASVHGTSGPVAITGGTYRSERASADFIAAAGALGIPEVADLQDMDPPSHTGGVSRALRFVSDKGVRSDVAAGYLHPVLRDGQRRWPNLHVLTEHNIVRVLFDDEPRARGIEIVPNPAFQGDESTTTTTTIKARRLVVLSCGALSSPLVLQRSGVGPKQVLERAGGVPLVADVQGVGAAHKDHPLMIYPYRSTIPIAETATPAVFMEPEVAREQLALPDGRFGWNGQDVAVKLRPSEAEVRAVRGDAFRKLWEEDYEAEPSRSMSTLAFLAASLWPPSEDGAQGMMISAWPSYPRGSGHIHITGPSPSDKPEFATGILTDPLGADLQMSVWTYKKQREIMRRMSFFRGEIPEGHPRFPAGSKAAPLFLSLTGPSLVDLSSAEGGGDGDARKVQDVVYAEADDAAIEEWIRLNISTTWHHCATAKMAPREEGGAVGAKLDVYGVKGLKLVDNSIIPDIIGCNTCHTTIAIAEKASDIIAAELGVA